LEKMLVNENRSDRAENIRRAIEKIRNSQP
jgi:hypothetical protein